MNSLPHAKNVDLSKVKEFTDDNLYDEVLPLYVGKHPEKRTEC